VTQYAERMVEYLDADEREVTKGKKNMRGDDKFMTKVYDRRLVLDTLGACQTIAVRHISVLISPILYRLPVPSSNSHHSLKFSSSLFCFVRCWLVYRIKESFPRTWRM
jgi:hypothetical protein